jgi:hypothetical protein
MRNQQKADEHRDQLRLGMMLCPWAQLIAPFRAAP